MSIRDHSANSFLWRALVFASALLLASYALAQDSEEASDEEGAVELQRVEVTGSRIKRTEIEGPAPVVVLTSDQMEQEGFTTVYEALNSLTQNVSSVQDDQFLGFTPTANAIDLRGLGPGRTLLLMDGRRITDYPLPYNSQSNLVNLSTIPIGMVDRIEVLLGGASAIYGSDAIAGVINVITKKDLDDHTISLRYGDTSDGGGESIRAQLTGGFLGDRWSFTYGLEYLDRDPIWGHDRNYLDSSNDDPSGVFVNSRTFLLYDPFGFWPLIVEPAQPGLYVPPDPDWCGSNGDVFSFRPGRGNYCGRDDDVGFATVRNGQKNWSIFTNFSFELTDTSELFGSVNYLDREVTFNSGSLFWQQTDPFGFVNVDFPVTYDLSIFGIGLLEWPQLQGAQRVFTPEEVGGLDTFANEVNEEVYEIVGGIRGVFADTWDWQLFGSVAQYDLEQNDPRILAAEADEFFLGDRILADNDGLFGVPVVSWPGSEFHQPVTPEQFRSFLGNNQTNADSSNAMVQFTVTGELFEMPAGPVGFAGLLEWGTQEYNITLDPLLVDGAYFGITGTGGGGDRDRYAAAAEFRFPLFPELMMNAAIRYDEYDDITEVDGAWTYNLGLEFRPMDSLLLRGNFATSFRAPDMHFIYAGLSGFFTGAPDYYLCARDEPDVPLSQCSNSQVFFFGQREGNPALEEETGESWSVGFVWEIMDNLSVSVDYYDIKLEDIVNDLFASRVLADEADCRLGGGRNDPDGEYCALILSLITRNPADGSATAEQIQQVDSFPFNRAVQENEGIDATLKYFLNTEVGSFELDFYYTHVLDAKFASFADEPVLSYRDSGTQELRSRFRGTFTWSYRDFTTSLLANRLGSNLTYDSVFIKGPDEEAVRHSDTWWFNWTASYNFTDDIRGSVIVQNVFNKKPPISVEESWPGGSTWPWFNQFVYDPFGREIFLQLDWTFGGR
jgi:outer membrane receptor protein involved in Fe transport